jgi:hypothetical protein
MEEDRSHRSRPALSQHSPRKTHRAHRPAFAGIRRGLAVSAALLFAGVGLRGCVGYNVYPPMAGYPAFADPNSPPMYFIMGEALRWTIQKYPPGDAAVAGSEVAEPGAGAMPSAPGGESPRIAISLVPGMRRDYYIRTAQLAGPGVVPLTPETRGLPTYLVSRIWVGGDSAKVDLFRPVTRMGNPDGSKVYQGLTLNLRGGLHPWHVTSHKVWGIGALEIPEETYLPEHAGESSVPVSQMPGKEPPEEPSGGVEQPQAQPPPQPN